MKMNTQIREEWLKEISAAKKRSKKKSNLSAFTRLHKDQAQRASYFIEIADVISNLGLSNPHEKSALSLEPTHPIQIQQLDATFDKLGINPLLRSNYKESKLSLISLDMLKSYSPKSDAINLIKAGNKAPFYLLDPLYGFVFLPQERKIGNHCFTIDIWSSHLKSMPVQLSEELWKYRSDNMLSGGAYAGRLLFKDLIPNESDPLKRAMPPIMYANSESELREIIRDLEASVSSIPNVELWFRGQTKDYMTPDRSVLTRLGITPYSNIRDSDFTSSLYRKYDDFLESTDMYEGLIIELAEWVHVANQIIPDMASKKEGRQIDGVATVDSHGLSSYQRGLVLQQYGAPSAYLDITHDPNIAAWFATRKCNINSDKKMVYEEYSWNSPNSDEWPTLFVFPLVKGLHPYLDLNSLLDGSDAKRPERQKCGLLGGAGNLARNYCARYLGMKIRLGPNFKLSKPFQAADLFPPESEDMVLKHLKEAGLGKTDRQFPLSELA